MINFDPYVYPGTNILVNKFGIYNLELLGEVERATTWYRRQELQMILPTLPPNAATFRRGNQ